MEGTSCGSACLRTALECLMLVNASILPSVFFSSVSHRINLHTAAKKQSLQTPPTSKSTIPIPPTPLHPKQSARNHTPPITTDTNRILPQLACSATL